MATRAIYNDAIQPQFSLGANPQGSHRGSFKLRARKYKEVGRSPAKPLSPGSNPGVALFYYTNNYPKTPAYQALPGLLIVVNVLKCTPKIRHDVDIAAKINQANRRL